MVIWSLAVFYVALGSFLVWVGADRLAQTMYDFAQKLSHLQFGWAILGGLLGMGSLLSLQLSEALILACRGYVAVIISFPPCIGHTTLVTLCGFAYGMKGFYLAAPASMLGSAAAFVVLRFLFSRRLKKWSSSNEKWQALEAVVVCLPFGRMSIGLR